MGNSDSWKPGARPGGNPPPAKPDAASSKPTSANDDASAGNAAGRVIHDERGNAVWDWLKDTARIAIDSTSRLLMRLEVPELKMEDTAEQELRMESDRDAGGGYDPYGGSGSTTSGRNATSPRPSSARSVGNPDGARGGSNSASSRGGTYGNVGSAGGSRGGTFNNAGGSGGARGGSTSNNSGGGYDPYGKGVTSKPTRKP
jgi:hypothetical protein